MRTKSLILALVVCLATAGAALAKGGVELPRWVLGGGASDSAAAGEVILRATLGQPVVGVVSDDGGEVTLGQGFWRGGSLAEGGYTIHLPLIMRG
jgi:hypothetical protein